ncbi:flap endonuclease GEN homolog 1 [Lampetra planeri]
MGVTDLWTVLSPVRERVPLSALAGLTIAVDLAVWVCEAQSVKGMANSVKRPHLRNLFFRVSLLCRLGLRLVFVVEGDAPALKAGTMAQRNEARFGPSARVCRGKANRAQLRATLKECCELLSSLGLPCLQAAGEGEALCAALDAAGLVHGCFTDDGDAFLYGARTVYRGLAVSDQDPHVERYCVDRIRRELGLDRDALIGLAVLLGCDYLPKGVKGIGKELALKLIHSLQGESLLNRFRAWRKGPSSGAHRPEDGEGHWRQRHCTQEAAAAESAVRRKALECPGFPHEDVIAEFRSHKDKLPLQLQWSRPNLQKVVDVVERKLEWPPHYTCHKLLLLLATYDLQECVAGHRSKWHLQPVRIVKTCVRAGAPCFEVEWEKPDGFVSEAGKAAEPLVTVERRDLVLAALPPLVAEFQEKLDRAQEQKRRAKANGRKRGGVKPAPLPALQAGPPGDDSTPHCDGEQLTAHHHDPCHPHRPTPTSHHRPAEGGDFSGAASTRPGTLASVEELGTARRNVVGAHNSLNADILLPAVKCVDGGYGQQQQLETSTEYSTQRHDGCRRNGATQSLDTLMRTSDGGGFGNGGVGGATCGIARLHSLLEELHLSDVEWSSSSMCPTPPATQPLPAVRNEGPPLPRGVLDEGLDEEGPCPETPTGAATVRLGVASQRCGSSTSQFTTSTASCSAQQRGGDRSSDPDRVGSEQRVVPGASCSSGIPHISVASEVRSKCRVAESRASKVDVKVYTPSPTQLSLRDRVLLKIFMEKNQLVRSGTSPKPSQSSVEFMYSLKCKSPNGSQLQASHPPIAGQNKAASASENELGTVKSIGIRRENTQTPPDTLHKTVETLSEHDAKPGVGAGANLRGVLIGKGARHATEAPVDLSDSELDLLVAEKIKSLTGKMRSHSDSAVKHHRTNASRKPCGVSTARHASDSGAVDSERVAARARERSRRVFQCSSSSDEVSDLEEMVEMRGYGVTKSKSQRLPSDLQKNPMGRPVRNTSFKSVAQSATHGSFATSRGGIGVAHDVSHPSAGLSNTVMPASPIAEQRKQKAVASCDPGAHPERVPATTSPGPNHHPPHDISPWASPTEAGGILHPATGDDDDDEGPSCAPSDGGGKAGSLWPEGNLNGVFIDVTDNTISTDSSDENGYLRRAHGQQWNTCSSGSRAPVDPDVVFDNSSSCIENTDLIANGPKQINLCKRNTDISKIGRLVSKSASEIGAPRTLMLGARFADVKPKQAPVKCLGPDRKPVRGIDMRGQTQGGTAAVAVVQGRTGDRVSSVASQRGAAQTRRGEVRGDPRVGPQERWAAQERVVVEPEKVIVISDGSDVSLTESPQPLAQRVALRLRVP